jgi:hypothetical protein
MSATGCVEDTVVAERNLFAIDGAKPIMTVAAWEVE